MNVQRELERFVRQQLFRERAEPISVIELRHAAAGSKGSPVDDFDFANVNTDNVSTFVDDIIGRAQSDANGLGGVQRYELQILVGEKKLSARFPFRLRGEDESLDDVSGDESATAKGLMTQLMRHSEQQQRTMISGIGAMTQLMARTIDRQEETIEKLLAERERDRERIEAAKSGEHQRELELMDAHRKEQREEMMLGKINTLFPLLVNKLSGKDVMTSQEKSVLAGFVDSLTEEQFHKITSALSPEQQILLFSALKELKTKALPNGQS